MARRRTIRVLLMLPLAVLGVSAKTSADTPGITTLRRVAIPVFGRSGSLLVLAAFSPTNTYPSLALIASTRAASSVSYNGGSRG